MERAYIDQLNHAYDDFFGDAHNGPPVLALDTNTLNYIASPGDLKWVENRIRQALKMTPFQSELPLGLEGSDRIPG
jgi:hypothetical protein